MAHLNTKRGMTFGIFAAAAVIALTVSSSVRGAQPAALSELRIGYQKNGVLYIAKQTGQLDAALKARGLSVKWVEFSFGPPLLEALNVGSIDYGTTGDAPPIFAQAAGAHIDYVAAQAAAGVGSAILVKADSPIKTLADLKGKKIGFAKASSAHNLTVAALEKAGLTYNDITPVYLTPADGAAAFTKGAIDAWTIWDPYYAVAEVQPQTRVLSSAKGIVAQNTFFLANDSFVKDHPEAVALVNSELSHTGNWIDSHHGEVAQVLAEATGISVDIQAKALERSEFSLGPITDKIILEQQGVADRFYKLGLIPKAVDVRAIVWKNPGAI